MNNFAQALARIEGLLNTINNPPFGSIDRRVLREAAEADLVRDLRKHADSIVQLAKVAAEMRDSFHVEHFASSACVSHINKGALADAGEAYDRLMNGDK